MSSFFDRGFPSKTLFVYKLRDGTRFEYDYDKIYQEIGMSDVFIDDDSAFEALAKNIIYNLYHIYGYEVGINGEPGSFTSEPVSRKNTLKLYPYARKLFLACFSKNKESPSCKFVENPFFSMFPKDVQETLTSIHYSEFIVAFMLYYLSMVKTNHPYDTSEFCRIFYEEITATAISLENFQEHVEKFFILMTDPDFCMNREVSHSLTEHLLKIGGRKRRSRRYKKKGKRTNKNLKTRRYPKNVR
jgi:hypothetical protein